MVNYPHQISRKIAQVRPKKSNRVDFANRGMSFESAINALMITICRVFSRYS